MSFTEMKNVTIDVENGYFNKFYVLLTSVNTQAISGKNFSVDVYYEGEEKPVNVQVGVDADATLLTTFNTIAEKLGETSNIDKLWKFSSDRGYGSNSPWQTRPVAVVATKKADKFTLKIAEGNRVLLIPSIIGEKATVRQVVNLITDTTVTAENIQAQEAILADVENVIAASDVAEDVANDAELNAKITALKASINAYYTALEVAKLDKLERVDVPLVGANSWVYAPYGTTINGINDPTSKLYKEDGYDFVYDWKQTLWWDSAGTLGLDNEETDPGSTRYTWTHNPVYYKVNGTNTKDYINLDENNNWKLPYLDGEELIYLSYNIKTDQKVVQLMGTLSSTAQVLSEKAKEAYEAKMTGMQNVAVDINNDYYNKFYVLAATTNSQGLSDVKFSADVYYEGEETPVNVPIGLDAWNNDSGKLHTIYNDTAAKIEGQTIGTKVSNYKSDMGYASNTAWQTRPVEVDSTKKVDKIVFKTKESNRSILIISIISEKPTVRQIVNLITDTTVNEENIQAQEATLATVENALLVANIDLAVADAELNAKVTELKAAINAYYAGIEAEKLEKWEYKNISMQNGANSKMFAPKDTVIDSSKGFATTEYNYVTDYYYFIADNTVAVQPDYEGEKITVNNKEYTAVKEIKHRPLWYSTTETAMTSTKATYIALDENYNWNVTHDGITYPYHLDVNGKIVYLNKLNSSKISQFTEEQKADFAKLNNVTVDIEDDYYSTINLLATSNFQANVITEATVEYADGSVGEVQSFTILQSPALNYEGKNGYVYSNDTLECAPGKYYTYKLNCDPTKKVSKITFNNTHGNRPVTIISMLGETATIKAMLEKISADVTAQNYLAQKALVEKIDAELLTEDIDLAVADAVLYEKFNTIKNNVEGFNTFEIKAIEKSGSDVTVTFCNFTGAPVTGKLIVAQYTDAKEKELKKVQIVDITLENNETSWTSAIETEEGNTVKFFLWKDLLNFFPYF